MNTLPNFLYLLFREGYISSNFPLEPCCKNSPSQNSGGISYNYIIHSGLCRWWIEYAIPPHYLYSSLKGCFEKLQKKCVARLIFTLLYIVYSSHAPIQPQNISQDQVKKNSGILECLGSLQKVFFFALPKQKQQNVLLCFK